MTKREVCPTCKGCGHVIVLNWSEPCPKCKRTGFVKPEPKKPADGVPGSGCGRVGQGGAPCTRWCGSTTHPACRAIAPSVKGPEHG